MQKVKELREKKGLTQVEFAKALDLAQSTISEIEAGRLTPSLRTLRKMAKALGVSVAALLDDEKPLDTGTEG